MVATYRRRFANGSYSSDESGIVGVATSAAMRAALNRVVSDGKGFAESIAPVDTGEYRSSFKTVGDTRGEGTRKRARAQLVNDSDHAAAVEFGNRRVPGQRVLGRTLDWLKKP